MPRIFENYTYKGVNIWQIGCLNCFDPNTCNCFPSELRGSRILNTVKTSHQYEKVAILSLNTDFSFPLWAGKYQHLKKLLYLDEGLNLICKCSLNKLVKFNLIKPHVIHLKPSSPYVLMRAGTCNNELIEFFVQYKSGNFPSLGTLSQLAVIKACHSKSNLNKLAMSGEIPRVFTSRFFKITYRFLVHQYVQEKYSWDFATCSRDAHPNVKFSKYGIGTYQEQDSIYYK